MSNSNLNLSQEVWDTLRHHISETSINEAATDFVQVLLDAGFSVTDIGETFGDDTEITDALDEYRD